MEVHPTRLELRLHAYASLVLAFTQPLNEHMTLTTGVLKLMRGSDSCYIERTNLAAAANDRINIKAVLVDYIGIRICGQS